MALTIIGATHKGVLEVDVDGRALTQAVVESDMENRNEKGFAWSLPFDAVNPTAGDDIFAYLQNTDPSLSIHVRRIRVSSTVVGMLEVIRATGTAAGGSGVTLVNFNQAFAAKTPTGIFETGADITGLTDGGKYAFQQIVAIDTNYDIHIPHDIILGKNDAVALNWVPATGVLTGTIWFFVHE